MSGGASGFSATGVGGNTAGAGAASGDAAGASDPTGGEPSVGGASGTLGNGGNAGTAGDTTGAGGAASGGTSAGAGGTAASGGNGTASGGVTATGGTPATAGGGSGGNQFQPLCDNAVVKGSACGVSSTQSCYRACGPDSIGFKSETCQQGAYVEQLGCSFPSAADYSCYQIPHSLPAECPSATVPRAAQACQISQCIVCFGGTVDNPTYEDSTGAPKPGYCVCSDSGAWTCGSVSAWPCPGGAGCN